MALTPKQQAQYNQLIAAGASQSAAMNAAMLVPDTTAPVTSTQPTPPTTQTTTAPTPPPPTATQSTPSNFNAGYTPPNMNASAQAPQTQDTSTTQAPPTINQNLQPGSKGQDVSVLQSYLTQMGYLTPEQVSGGQGVYGPQTTAAVAQLQKDLGIQAGSASGYYGPQTKAALASKYQSLFKSLSGTAPDNAGIAKAQIQDQIQQQNQPSTDPVFGAMFSSLAPIMASLSQVLQNINNPALTAVSLQQEYNDLASQNNLPAMQANLMNMQNIMNGTEDDIRAEVTKAGGFATDSQVLGLAAARNKVILKQYNALATQYQAAQTNIQNQMQYATSDQQTQLQRQTATAGIVESMASIESQMMSMGMTMQQNASSNVNKIVTNVGYQGLAASAQDNPQVLGYYEKTLGLAPGTLSNPTALSQLETYRQQTIAQGQQKVNIQMYNSGIGGNPTVTNSNTPGLYVNNTGGIGGQSLVSLNSNGSDSQGRPYSMSQAQGKNLLANGATIDPGTNNIVIPGVGYYIGQSDGSYRLSVDPSTVDGQFIQYRNRAENPTKWEPTGSLSNQRMTRNALTRQTNSALTQYVDSTLYKNVSSAATYFAKLDAGLRNPGSVGDPDIIDSLVKINTGGQGAITEQQYAAYAQGQTWADKFQVVNGKVVGKGGTLSPDQRSQIQRLAQDTFSNYRSEYEQMYVQAMKNLDNQGIPDAFWGNMPDWTSLINGVVYNELPVDTSAQ